MEPGGIQQPPARRQDVAIMDPVNPILGAPRDSEPSLARALLILFVLLTSPAWLSYLLDPDHRAVVVILFLVAGAIGALVFLVPWLPQCRRRAGRRESNPYPAHDPRRSPLYDRDLDAGPH
jgi:hypothetical protein